MLSFLGFGLLLAFTPCVFPMIPVISGISLVQADVTQDNDAARSLLRTFNLIGPPAILFFGPDQMERKPHRIVGFIGSGQLLAQFSRMMK